ncbi:uncharacterized protein LOC128887674 [Hylaeus anthracinus]|uniref:uncharacterized protein LOC128887674 n=1 Tax=Hylaeus anthracinus TaxID=313031 RepID=UPI0023B9BEFE|nr:uncharacterized protein LOC128887674 [Hylaeus anthracinus]
MDVLAAPQYYPACGPAPGRPPRRWALKRFEKDAQMASALAASWTDAPTGLVADVDREADWFRGSLTAACDAAMPRARKLSRHAAYWWSDEIAALRATCNASCRRFTRARRRRNRDRASEAALYEVYREATVDLQRATRRAKASARGELLETLDKDPWGRPYRIMLGRMRPAAPPVTESLDPPVLQRVVDTLFPVDPEEGPRPLLPAEASNWSAGLGVTEGKLGMVVGRIMARNTAPGPDGIPERALALALRVLGPRPRRLCHVLLQFKMPKLCDKKTRIKTRESGFPNCLEAWRAITRSYRRSSWEKRAERREMRSRSRIYYLSPLPRLPLSRQ